jgi:hypothetical protein
MPGGETDRIDTMNFSTSLQSKIAARHVHGSSVMTVADTLRQQAFDRIKPLHDAVFAMAERLAVDPIFAAGFGDEPDVEFRWNVISPSLCSLIVSGPVGSFRVQVSHRPAFLKHAARTSLKLNISPSWALAKMLGCGHFYATATPVEGDAEDLSGFLVASEDMIAEFLADVVTRGDVDKFLPGAF